MFCDKILATFFVITVMQTMHNGQNACVLCTLMAVNLSTTLILFYYCKKPTICMCENEDADQLCAFVFANG